MLHFSPMSDFVHLHVHSHYSLLGALPKTKDLIAAVKDRGMSTFALTDNGALYGIMEMYQACQEQEIKLLIGMDAYMAPEGRLQKRARIDKKTYRLVLLVENNLGYRNLLEISSLGFLEGFYYVPRIDKEILQRFCQNKEHGLIALSGGFQGEIDQLLSLNNRQEAKKCAQEYADLFGKEHFYLELVDRPEIPEQAAINAQLIELGKELHIPVVATKNVFYLNPEDTLAWKILQCVKGGKTLEQYERMQAYEYDASLVDGDYMKERFKDVPEAIENTKKIADRCQVELKLNTWNFPKFPLPEGKTALEVLQDNTIEGLKKRGVERTAQVQERITYELNIISAKGYDVYFLVVADFINWARQNKIATTTRGSAAGSLVAYATGISDINPLVYQLPFERFLNPDRPSAPDIDADFADNRRDEVLKYVCRKYGEDKVAQICTFGKMLARGSLRDVGRALGYPYAFVDQVAKQVPMGKQGMPMNLQRALRESPELKKMYDTDGQVKRLVDLSQQIEGCARHVSIHAAGAVVAPTHLNDFTPLQIDTREGKVITQYEMHAVEAAGLVKMDFLGIRNLSILGDAVRLVKKIKDKDIILGEIPVDDPKAFALLSKGRTMGLFQLNGDGMTKYLMELEPTRIEDIMAMVALYRPGPIEFIPEYIKRKHHPELIDYPHECLKDILEKSLGLLIYQDDIMLTAIKLAGYSWLEADKFRKAMGKKIPELMVEQKKKFKEGCIANNISKVLVDDLWNRIEPFAFYAFNKAHAASYGMVAYQTAYLKANYPTEYMTALLTAESGDLETIAEAVEECRKLGINVLPPDINESRSTFTYINDKTIRFGLLVVKNLGEEVIKCLIIEREKNGSFKDLTDFVTRVEHRAFNKKSLEALIKSGALDCFGERNQLWENIEMILRFHKHAQQQKQQNQASLFDSVPSLGQTSIQLKKVPVAKKTEKLAWEKELLGLYVSAHPFEELQKQLEDITVSCANIPQKKKDSFVYCAGLINSVKEIITKKGELMAFLQMEDLTGRLEAIVFPKVYEQIKTLCQAEKLVVFSAKISRREGEETKLLVNKALALSEENVLQICEMLKRHQWDLEIKEDIQHEEPPVPHVDIILRGQPEQQMIQSLQQIFRSAPGSVRVCFLVEQNGHTRRVATDYFIDSQEEVIDRLSEIVGRQNIQIPVLP